MRVWNLQAIIETQREIGGIAQRKERYKGRVRQTRKEISLQKSSIACPRKWFRRNVKSTCHLSCIMTYFFDGTVEKIRNERRQRERKRLGGVETMTRNLQKEVKVQQNSLYRFSNVSSYKVKPNRIVLLTWVKLHISISLRIKIKINIDGLMVFFAIKI